MILIVHLLGIIKIYIYSFIHILLMCSLVMIVRKLKMSFLKFFCKIVYCNIVYVVGYCLINILRGCHGHDFP